MAKPTIDFVCAEPTAVHFYGHEAQREFERLLDCAYAETALGGVYGYRWAAQGEDPFNRIVAPLLTRIEDPAKLDPLDFNMVILDSGNTDGDSWKYVYHPMAQSGTFMQES